MAYKNIEDSRRYAREHYKRNKKKALKYARKRYANNPEFRERVKEYEKKNRKKSTQLAQKRRAFIKLHFPWISHWQTARQRCINPNRCNYRYYGEKGIRMLLTKEETRKLYIRDRAWELNQPTIDRINPGGDYCLDNCRFIETAENISIAHKGKKLSEETKKKISKTKQGPSLDIKTFRISEAR